MLIHNLSILINNNFNRIRIKAQNYNIILTGVYVPQSTNQKFN